MSKRTQTESPWPTRIEFDEVAEYFGGPEDATSEATDDYFAGYDVPRDATTLPGADPDDNDPTDGDEIIARDGNNYRVGRLRAIFNAVADPDDWRGPIRALIPASGHGAVDAAVEFFTATRIRVTDGPELGTGRILIEADGYRAGPAGDH